MKDLFIVTQTSLEAWEASFDDISVDTSVKLFNTLEEAQEYVKGEVEEAIEEFCHSDEDMIDKFGEDGYSEKNISEMESYIATWDSNGGGTSKRWTIEKQELRD